MMASSLPRRKSAQKAEHTMKKYAVLLTPNQINETDSDSIKEELVTSESSNSDQSSNGGGSGSGSTGQGADELMSDEEDDRKASSHLSQPKRKKIVWDTVTAYNEVIASYSTTYQDKLNYLPLAELTAAPAEVTCNNITVNNTNLASYTAHTTVGFTGGSVVCVENVPSMGVFCVGVTSSDCVGVTSSDCVGVTSSDHLVPYTDPSIHQIQVWSSTDEGLQFSYLVRVSSTKCSGFIVYPYRDTDNITLCVPGPGQVAVLKVPTTNTTTNTNTQCDVTNTQYDVTSSSLVLKVLDEKVLVTRVAWALFDGRVSVIGGLSTGCVVIWRLSRDASRDVTTLNPIQSVWAHPGHPITSIAVNPQSQQHFGTTALEPRIKLWNVKNLSRTPYSQNKAQKQLLLPTRSHWCMFWNTLLSDTLYPNDKTKRHRTRCNNNSISQLHLGRFTDPLARFHNVAYPWFFPDSTYRQHITCYSFNDKHSVIAVGYQSGGVGVFKVLSLWCRRDMKKHKVSTVEQYLSLTATVDNPEVEQYETDKEYLDNHQFYVSSGNVVKLPEPTTPGSYVTKSLVSVSSIGFINMDGGDTFLVIGYLNGLMRTVKLSKRMTGPSG